jgi:hypothetical protein
VPDGYSPNAVFTGPRTRLVSMYMDQVPPADLSRGLSEKHAFQIFPTIREALTLGGNDLAVDAVCFVGEHGNCPNNERGQKLYPRYELMAGLDRQSTNGREWAFRQCARQSPRLSWFRRS